MDLGKVLMLALLGMIALLIVFHNYLEGVLFILQYVGVSFMEFVDALGGN